MATIRREGTGGGHAKVFCRIFIDIAIVTDIAEHLRSPCCHWPGARLARRVAALPAMSIMADSHHRECSIRRCALPAAYRVRAHAMAAICVCNTSLSARALDRVDACSAKEL